MQFTILSHASVCVEHNGVKIVSDPWLIGSCYWRSWWNFPEPSEELVTGLNPDFIYITHLHWDHFHGASLKKLFSPDTHILVPKVPTRRMVKDLEWLGFKNVTEIPHGTSIRLGNDFTLWSYQFGLGVDSAMVLTGGGYTLFDCNDCKLFGLPLRQISRRFPKFDFVLRSHSSASPVPYCIDSYETAFPDLRSRQDYIEEFSRFALHVGARYAIPFASNHCFLHKETYRFNTTAVVAEDVTQRFQELAARSGQKSECIVMAPGSKWSDRDGFEIVPFDYSKREEYVRGLERRHGDKLRAQYEKEQNAIADWASFEKYFRGFLRSIPWVMRKWLRGRIVFRIRDARGRHHWLVDMPANKVEQLESAPPDCVVIETPALVLNDCTRIWMFSVWSASKRLKVFLPTREHLRVVSALFSLLDFYELETLPLRKNFARRALAVRLRRWREPVEAARLLLTHQVLRRPFEISGLYSLPARTR